MMRCSPLSCGMDANYSVKRNPLSGAASVNFKCAACAAAVKFDLDDAGTRQPCPACGVALAVPGTREKQANEAAVTAKQEEQKRAKAERERAAKEIAEAEAERERQYRAFKESKEAEAAAPSGIGPALTAAQLESVIARGIVRGMLYWTLIVGLFSLVVAVFVAKFR